MDRMTDEQAAELLERIDTLTANLSVAEEQVERTHGLAKRLRLAVYALAVVVVGLGLVAWQQYELNRDLHDTQVAACESGNNRVDGQRVWMANYFDVARAGAEAQGVADGPIGDYYEALEKWTLDETLPYRDCDHLDKRIPQPGPAPSFDEALKAALAAEDRD